MELGNSFQELSLKLNEERIDEENQEDYEQIVYLLKPRADEVKGFDYKKSQLKKIQEGEHNLLEYLQRLNDKLTNDEISEVI